MGFRHGGGGLGGTGLLPAPASESIDLGDVAGQGIANNISLSDHRHPVPAPNAAPLDLAAAAAIGVSTRPAAMDHRHRHLAADHTAGGFADLTGTFMTAAAQLAGVFGGRIANAKDYLPAGVAAFDGGAHPLSDSYGTLAAAQLAFPNVVLTALTQETAWAALQQAINVVGDFGIVLVPAGSKIRQKDAIQIYNRQGLVVMSPGGIGSSADRGSAASGLYWYGAAGGVQVDINRSRGCTIEGFGAYPDAGGVATAAGISFKIAQDVAGAITTSNVTLRRFRIDFNTAPWAAGFIGVSIGDAGGLNAEEIRLEEFAIRTSFGSGATALGTGVKVLHSNCKNIVLARGKFQNCAIGVDQVNGGLHLTDIEFTENKLDVQGGGVDPLHVHDFYTEAGTGFYKGAAGATVAKFDAGHIAHPAGATTSFDVTAGVPNVLILEAVTWDAKADCTAISGQPPGGNSRLISRGNIYPAGVPNFQSFTRGFSSFGDSAATGGVIPPTVGGIDTTLVTSDAAMRFMKSDGTIVSWAQMVAAAAAANQVVTLTPNGDITARSGGGTQVKIGAAGSGGESGIAFQNGECYIQRKSSQLLVSKLAHLGVNDVGFGLRVAEGANAKQGTAVLVAGTVTVANTAVTANSRIMLTIQALGTVAAPKAIAVTARVAGTSFTITSSDATDTSTIAYEIFEPA